MSDAATPDGAARRFLLTAIGEPGHAFPVIAVAAELARRGHQVAVHTWENWQEQIEAEGVEFVKAPRFDLDPNGPGPLTMHEAAVLVARDMEQDIARLRPDVVVADVLTVGGSLAAELAGIPFATLVPHLFQVTGPEEPPFGSGFAPARGALGRRLFRAMHGPSERLLKSGRHHLNDARVELGLAPIDRNHGGLSEDLVLVATFPQLELQRDWEPHVKVVGPLEWQPPSEHSTVPAGDEPLVVVAPSTSQDPYHKLLSASLKGLAGKPVRVLGTTNRRPLIGRPPSAANVTVVDWLSYGDAFPQAAVVICHGGHGTMVRALAAGSVPIICPINGDQFENAARLRWAKCGVAVPALFRNRFAISLAVEKALSDAELRSNVQRLAEWAAVNNGAAAAANELELLAADPRTKGRQSG